MSREIALFSLLESTFALLLEKEKVGQNCEQLVQNLNLYVDELRESSGISDELLKIFTKLKINFVPLRACFKILQETAEARIADNPHNESELTCGDVKQEISKETGSNSKASQIETDNPSTEAEHSVRKEAKQPSKADEEHLLSHNRRYSKLQREVLKIRNVKEFKGALDNFREMNEASAKVFENENKISSKITATKLRIISEILGNLTDLTAAAEKCKEYIVGLHMAVLPCEDKQVKEINSVMRVNVFVFRFMKNFLGKSVTMLDWPMMYVIGKLYAEHGLKLYHPILGKLPATIDRPYPFTNISETNEAKPKINYYISAVNCIGEVFARAITSTSIIRLLTHGGNRTYNVDDGHDVLCISIDCRPTDSETPTQPSSEFGEASPQSSPGSCSQASVTCKGKMYILAQCKLVENFCCFLYVIDMEGRVEIRELGFMERAATEGSVRVKIFCIKDKKLLILDVTRCITHVCDDKGIQKNTIDASAYLCDTNDFRLFPIFTYNAEMICLESKFNFFSKLNVYAVIIGEEGSSWITKTNEIKIKREVPVQAIAFDHKLDQVISLCYTWSSGYHLVTYTKDGKIRRDIELIGGKRLWDAGLIFHPSGPVVLLNNDKLLRLK